MKHFLIISVCFAVLTISCKKSISGGNPYYIRATINGVAKTFNVNAIATRVNVSGSIINIGISGYVVATTSTLPEAFTMSINNQPSGKAILAGSYIQNISSNFVVGGAYMPGNSNSFYWAGAEPNPVNPMQITIISIDNTTFKGTFNGDFYYLDSATGILGPNKKTITNGEFNVKF